MCALNDAEINQSASEPRYFLAGVFASGVILLATAKNVEVEDRKMYIPFMFHIEHKVVVSMVVIELECIRRVCAIR